jgi:hypothetical protein
MDETNAEEKTNKPQYRQKITVASHQMISNVATGQETDSTHSSA